MIALLCGTLMIPGYPGSGHAYPLTGPDLAKARRLMRLSGVHTQIAAHLYTASDNIAAMPRIRILRRDLAKIGIHVHVWKSVPRSTQLLDIEQRLPYDLTDEGFDYLVDEPGFFLNYSRAAYLDTTPIRQQITDAAQLRGRSRYDTFGCLKLTLARSYAPLAAYAYENNIDLFSARIGCQTYVPVYGIDLTRLCTR